MTETLDVLSQEGRALLFSDARTANAFTEDPVGDDVLREIYELFRFAPTSANSNPLRILFVRSPEARARLVTHMSEGNAPKTSTAPAVAVLAADLDFHERIPELFPTRAHTRETWAADPERRERFARFNGAIQVGYFVLAIRAVGLAAGPMAGFDAEGVDGEFFAGTSLRSLLVVNIGRPAGPPAFPRLPRLAYEDAVTIV
jgi:3-hydroxypropanoate dehydrogenase